MTGSRPRFAAWVIAALLPVLPSAAGSPLDYAPAAPALRSGRAESAGEPDLDLGERESAGEPDLHLGERESAGEPDLDLGERVWVRPLSARAWVIRSVSALEGFGEVESNAVLVQGDGASVLVDTPATDAQTARVLAWAERTLRRPVRHLVVTHWHADRMGGIGAAHARRIETYALGKTRDIARAKGLVVPRHALGTEERLKLSGISLSTWYPGPGHTADNLVVWFPGDALLAGGCFVKASAATTLGNPREIDPVQWAIGIEALRRRYPGARSVVPGHGATGGQELLAHTATLLAPYPGAAVPSPASP